jgi:hypothetical protein
VNSSGRLEMSQVDHCSRLREKPTNIERKAENSRRAASTSEGVKLRKYV